jgi:hypothetical protein
VRQHEAMEKWDVPYREGAVQCSAVHAGCTRLDAGVGSVQMLDSLMLDNV